MKLDRNIVMIITTSQKHMILLLQVLFVNLEKYDLECVENGAVAWHGAWIIFNRDKKKDKSVGFRGKFLLVSAAADNQTAGEGEGWNLSCWVDDTLSSAETRHHKR